MGLKKGQCNNIAGRKVGSKNVATTDLKLWVKGLLEKNTELFEADLLELESKDRLSVLQGLLKYSIPTLQSVSAVDLIQTEYLQLQKLLDNASPAVIDLLSAKIIELSEKNNN